MTVFVDRIEAAVDAVLAELAGTVTAAMTLALGKPNPFINALYRRFKDMPQRRLRIVTALTLQRPKGKSEPERRFLQPFVERVFGDYPDLDYGNDVLAGTLPPNIEVCELFFKTGEYLGNGYAQQHHICSNYTMAARDMVVQGTNLVTQAVAAKEVNGKLRLSLSCNPDLVLELIRRLREAPDGRRFLSVAVINRQLPFMGNYADVDPEVFDYVITDPAATHKIFGAPNTAISMQDYAIGLHASSLVLDGGTLQIGIGSMGDSIAHSLILRENHNEAYRAAIDQLVLDNIVERQVGRFAEGLYGCSEMFVNGFIHLIEHGIVRRQVFNDIALQTLLNDGEITSVVSADTLRALHGAGRVSSPLTEADFDYLRRFGILRGDAVWDDGKIRHEGQTYDAVLDADGLAALAPVIGDHLKGGIHMHGGFFLGPNDFYQKLRDMPEDEKARIEMHCIEFINQTYGHGDIARAQRRNGRFINTTMMVTLMGAAVSDGLENGGVVSGVGGQYNFVAMAQTLRGGRSILLVRAVRETGDGARSNILWNYGHTTIPRHLRDIVVTEYGVADLRGRTDAEVIARMIAIADSRFQDELIAVAQHHHKLPQDFVLPEIYRNNSPDVLKTRLAPLLAEKLLPTFPFGTDFTPEELKALAAMQG